MLRILAVVVGVILTAGSTSCSGDSITDPSPPTLENAPSRVTIGGSELKLEAYLWRDFQPVSPPDGKPLIAVLRVRTADGGRLPDGIRVDQVSIVYNDDVWSAPVEEEFPSAQPSVLEVVAREGPKWQPGISVDVVVRIRDAEGRVYWLRAADQPIHRTD